MPANEMTWDVFVSHNRNDKPWVRQLVAQWTEHGHRVFFDDDSIAPGRNIVRGMDEGLDGSERIVLIISQASLDSQWVDHETKAAVFEDPGGRAGRLIPVAIEPIDFKQLPPSLRALRCVNLFDPETRDDEYDRLLDAIGLKTVSRLYCPDLAADDDEAESDPIAVEASPQLYTGPLPHDSPLYVTRSSDRLIEAQLQGRGTTVTIKGHGKSGKSSLMVRVHRRASGIGVASCYMDFESFDSESLQSTDRLLMELGQLIADELEIDADPEEHWSEKRSSKLNLTRFMEREVLSQLDRPIQLLFDRADLVFPYETPRKDLFSMLRSWHEKRERDLKDRWTKLSLVIAHATEPSLWIKQVNQSPFNVGLQVRLQDFSREDTKLLNQRFGKPLQPTDATELRDHLGGHPYLISQGLYWLATDRRSLNDLREVAVDQEGPFIGSLHYCRHLLDANQELRDAVHQIMQDGRCADEMAFQRLWASGLVRGRSRHQARLRCRLYEDYFRKAL